MVAVAEASSGGFHHLVVVRTTPAVPRPVVRPSAAIYRRRRLAALALVTSVLVALLVAVQLVGGSLGSGAAGAAAPSQPAALAGPVHIVQPGDTFWDIARALRPNDDPRPLVARLVAAHGSAVLIVGERIPLPAGA